MKKFIEELKLISYKGEQAVLPMSGFAQGNVVLVSGEMFICEDEENGIWRKVLTNIDLNDYYTKAEFDELYAGKMQLIEDLVSGRLYEYTQDFKQNFVTKAEHETFKAEFADQLSALEENIAAFAEWKSLKEQEVEKCQEDINTLSSYVSWLSGEWRPILDAYVRNDLLLQISAETMALISKQETIDEFFERLCRKLDMFEREATVAQALSGTQAVLGIRYEN